MVLKTNRASVSPAKRQSLMRSEPRCEVYTPVHNKCQNHSRRDLPVDKRSHCLDSNHHSFQLRIMSIGISILSAQRARGWLGRGRRGTVRRVASPWVPKINIDGSWCRYGAVLKVNREVRQTRNVDVRGRSTKSGSSPILSMFLRF